MNRWRHTLYVVTHGATVALQHNRVVVRHEDAVLAMVPLMLLERVVITASVGLSSKLLAAMLDRQIPLVLCTDRGRVRGRLEPTNASAADDRLRQLRLVGDDEQRIELAREVVASKIHNQRVLLQRRQRREESDDRVAVASELQRLRDAAGRAQSLAVLRGIEGAAAKRYFTGIRGILDERHAFGRRDRHGSDVVNALLNYVSAVLRERVVSSIAQCGLDPTLSFLHEPFRGRPTLAFDLMEPWRPVLVESTVLSLVGLGAVSSSDLEQRSDGRCLLNRSARSRAVDRFSERLETSYSAGGTSRAFGEWIDHQTLNFRAVLRDPTATPEAFRWR